MIPDFLTGGPEPDEIIKTLDLNIMLKELDQERKKLNVIKATYKERQDQFKAENKMITERKAELEHNIEAISDSVRGEAIMRFKDDGSKNQCSVKIIMKQLMEFQEKEAYSWCIAHKLFLTYNKSGFSKYAKENPVEFVEYSSEPQARIPSKIEVE